MKINKYLKKDLGGSFFFKTKRLFPTFFVLMLFVATGCGGGGGGGGGSSSGAAPSKGSAGGTSTATAKDSKKKIDVTSKKGQFLALCLNKPTDNLIVFLKEKLKNKIPGGDTSCEKMNSYLGEIKVLNLSSDKLRIKSYNFSRPREALEEFTNIEELYLNYLLLQDIDFVGQFKNLKILSVVGTDLTALPRLGNLRVLDISGTKITSIDFDHIKFLVATDAHNGPEKIRPGELKKDKVDHFINEEFVYFGINKKGFDFWGDKYPYPDNNYNPFPIYEDKTKENDIRTIPQKLASELSRNEHFPGLVNKGSTCFANATFKLFSQFINLNPDLLNYLKNTNNGGKFSLNKGNVLSDLEGHFDNRVQLRDLFRKIISNIVTRKNKGVISDKLSDFFTSMNGHFPHPKYHYMSDQMDPTEFFVKLSELFELPETPFATEITELTQTTKRVSFNDVRNTFLALSISDDSIKSIQQAVEGHFTTYDFTASDDMLNIGGEKYPFVRNFLFTKKPDMLLITLKRFEKVSDKITNKISKKIVVTNHLRIPIYDKTSLKGENSEKANFKISEEITMTPVAIVVHRGSTPNGGHYYAFLRGSTDPKNGGWTRHDDDAVIPIDGEFYNDISENAYMILYKSIPI